MTIDTFNWPVRLQASEDINISIIQVQFGDGYKQVASSGLNAAVETWSLSCNGESSNISVVRDFLKSHAIQSFWWTNPWGEKKLYRVKSDSIKPKFINGMFVDITFTFEQAFAP
ncbi:phage tail protein [Serratia proteamaculans]|uniref:phage tail protein n=1 Tax=Serratia proteamaculans TaxID=28151 RepID=UPI0021C8A62F|nr:phage tail protein [Serratia proteamaculans]